MDAGTITPAGPSALSCRIVYTKRREAVDEMAAEAVHFQRTGECVGTAVLTVLRHLIFKDYDNVHGVDQWN